MCSLERYELNLSCVNQGNSYCWQTGLSPQAFKVHVMAAQDCLKNTDKTHKLKKRFFLKKEKKNNQKGWNCKP